MTHLFGIRRAASRSGQAALVGLVVGTLLVAVPTAAAGADPLDNHPPTIPVLISPAPGDRLGNLELQQFTVRAVDPDGDLYRATITVKNEAGAVVNTYVTPLVESDANATVLAMPRLPVGTYSWTAKATDTFILEGQESSPATFTVTNGLPPGATTRVSISSTGAQATAAGLDAMSTSGAPKLSRDERYVAFESLSSTLVPGDTNGHRDVFVHDRQTGQTTRASIATSGAQADLPAGEPAISGDGRHVVFATKSMTFDNARAKGLDNVYVRDMVAGTTTRLSVPALNTSTEITPIDIDSYSVYPSISANGRFVAFAHNVGQLEGATTMSSGKWEVVVHDRDTDGDGIFDEVGAVSNSLVSMPFADPYQNGDAQYPHVSDDGRYVSFVSEASNLVSGDTNGNPDVFLRDRVAGTTTLVSRLPDGTPSGVLGTDISMSADGRFVAYSAGNAGIVGGDTNSSVDIFVYDRVTGATTRESLDNVGAEPLAGPSSNPSLSPDGRYVAFYSLAPNLVFGDTNGMYDTFVRDRSTATTTRVSVDSCGGQGVGADLGNAPSMGGSGRFVAFGSGHTNLVPGDTNGLEDIFVHDRFADELFGFGSPVKGETSLSCLPAGVARSDATGLEDFYPYHSWNLGAETAYANMANGNLVVQASDIEAAGRGLNLRLTRTYNSLRANHDGPLGRGWTLGVADGEDMLEGLVGALTSLDLGRVAEAVGTEDQFDFYDADGTRHHFTKGGLAGPGWHSPPGVNLMLADFMDSQNQRWYTATRPDGVRYEFHPDGFQYRLTLMADRKGNQLTFAYDAGGRLSTITDPAGRTITMSWSGSYLTRAEYRAGTSTSAVTYNIDQSLQRLGSVTQAAGTSDARTISYAYANGGTGLSQVTDARGGITHFGGQNGVLQMVTDRAGKAWTLTYGGPTCAAAGGGLNSAVCLADPEGHVSTWTSSPLRNLVDHADAGDMLENGSARANHRQFAWAGNRIRKEIDEAANVTEYEWNAIGQPVRVKTSGNADPTIETTFAYRMVDAGVGYLADVRAAAGTADERVTTFVHNNDGTLSSTTDPEGKTTSFTYHGRGLLKSVTDANNRTTTFGDSSAVDLGYDPSGQPKRIVDPTQQVKSFVYDFMGRNTQVTDRNGKTWSYEYDLRGNRTREITPLTHATVHCFDANDNEVSTIRPKVIGPHCAMSESDAYVTKRVYDARDVLSEVRTKSDGQLRKTVYTLADDGEVSGILEPRSFDGAGNQLPTVQQALYERFPNNRVAAFVDEEGNRTETFYTPNGLPRTVLKPAGSSGRHTTTYSYNGRDLVTSQLDLGHSQPTVHTYNAHGDRISTKTPKGATTTFVYDKAGRLVRTVDALGKVARRGYDNVGNLVTVGMPTGTGGELVTSYTYTARNEIDTESDPANPAHLIDYDYDAEGRQRFRHDRLGGLVQRTTEHLYLDDGNVSQTISSFAGAAAGKHVDTFGYDANGNTTSAATTLDGATSPNVSSITTAYTTADEVASWTETLWNPSGGAVTKALTYSYGPDGLLVSRTADGATTTHAALRNGWEQSTTPWGGTGSVGTEYFADGSAKRRTLPGGTVVDQRFDLAERLVSRVFTRSDGTVLSAWDNLTWDDDDNRMTEHVRQLLTDNETVDEGVGTYGYDMSGRMTQSKHPFEEDATPYGVDDAGNIVTEADFAYTYVNNRLISRQTVPPGLAWSYAHDAYGNQVSESVGTMTTTTSYDASSRSRRVTSPDGSWVEYAYDALDRVVRRHDSTGVVVLFFHDASSEQIALETDGAGSVRTRYILDSAGQPLGNETIGTGGRGWFLEDPRGNVSQLVDGSGVVKGTFSYDPFGKEKAALTSKAAGWDSRLRFQAAPRDPKTGMYTLGPRLLDPSINRFIGADNYVGAAANMELALDPLTGNRYLYAGANPANLVDDGHDPSVAQSSLDTFLHELTKFANEAIAHCKKKRGHCVNDRFIRQAAKSIAGLDPGRWVVAPEGPRRVAPPGEIRGESGWKASLIDGDNSPARHFFGWLAVGYFHPRVARLALSRQERPGTAGYSTQDFKSGTVSIGIGIGLRRGRYNSVFDLIVDIRKVAQA